MKRLGLMLILLLLASVAPAKGRFPGPLVGADWLLGQKDRGDILILDIQEPPMYVRHHIPGAVNLPFSQWRTGSKGKPPMSLPPLAVLAERLGRLGITRETPLVIVATGTGAGDLAAAARVWWSLAALGHEDMAILDGGLVSWVNEFKSPYTSGMMEDRQPARYEPRPRRALLATREELLKGVKQPLLDARSPQEHLGLIAAAGDRPGTIPGAHNLPFDWLVDGKGRLRSREAIRKLFAWAGVPSGRAVHFCHTGNRAALTWFADYAVLGNPEARLYDGSILDWSAHPEDPMERKLDLNEGAQ